jgi:hypothetical protein
MFANSLMAAVMLFQQGGDAGAPSWDLVSMWQHMDIPAKSVVGILFIMSAWSVGIMIDRALMYSAAISGRLSPRVFRNSRRRLRRLATKK